MNLKLSIDFLSSLENHYSFQLLNHVHSGSAFIPNVCIHTICLHQSHILYLSWLIQVPAASGLSFLLFPYWNILSADVDIAEFSQNMSHQWQAFPKTLP